MSLFSVFKKTFIFILLTLSTFLHLDGLQAFDCSTTTIVLSPSTLPSDNTGTAYSQPITASGGVAPYTFTLSGTLPSGLVFNTTGPATATISGTPTTVGTYVINVTATDSNGCLETSPYILIINCPNVSFATTTLGAGTTGTPYSQTINVGGGTPPYTFSLTTGALPPGLVLSSGGVISGTPTLAGVYNFVVRARDSDGCVAAFPYTLIVNCPNIAISTSSPLSSGTDGAPYTQSIVTTGGTAPLTFSVASGSLPAGLILNSSTGVIAGTPIHAGYYEFVMTATDSDGCSASVPYILVINCSGLSITTTTLSNGTTGVSYTQTIGTSGGVNPLIFSIANGALPPGLILNPSTGVISGTPTFAGNYNFIVTATDSDGCMASMPYSLIVNCPSITFNTTSPLTSGTTGIAYSQAISVNAPASSAPLTYSVISGSLPNGLILNSTTGTIAGIPILSGSYEFVINVKDRFGCSVSSPFILAINCTNLSITTTSPLPNGTAGTFYNQLIATSGGTQPLTFSVTGGSLPPGLFLNPTAVAPTPPPTLPATLGQLSGTPIHSGYYEFIITVQDADGCTASKQFTLNINCSNIAITSASLPNGTVGTAYNNTVLTSGGVSPLTFSVISGSLPAEIILNPTTGALLGTPLHAGVYPFVINVTDSVGCSATQPLTLIVNCPNVTINTTSLPNGTTGTPYSQTISTSNGVAPLTFSVTSGSLPPELILNSTTGVLFGTPIHSGTYAFVITVTDADGCSASMPYVLIINCPNIAITTTSLTSATTGTFYSQSITVTGGTAPLTYSITSGTLPTGLILNPSAGQILGTPILAGTYEFVVQVTDSDGCSASMPYVLIVNCPGLTINTTSLPNGTTGTFYSQTLSVTGGTPPLTFSVTNGMLPTGIILNPLTGQISGTPLTTGTFNFVISVRDSDGCLAARPYIVIISCPAMTITPSTLPSGVTGTTYTATLVASGGSQPYTFGVTSGSLPTGLLLNPMTGVISGVPLHAGAFTFISSVTDSFGCNALQYYTIIISCSDIAIVTPSPLPDATKGEFYSQMIVATASSPPISFNLTSGALPTGLILNTTTGLISGIPTQAGTFEFVITVMDIDDCAAAMPYILIVSCPSITITPTSIPNGVTGTPYSATLVASGGGAPYSYIVTSGALPPGLVLNSMTGMIFGTPVESGAFTFIVTATDSFGCMALEPYTLIITCPAISFITPASLPSGTTDVVYSKTINSNGGTPPLSYTVTSGTLPPGLILTPSTGVLSGLPSHAGTYDFVITVTDINGCSAAQSFLLQILCPAMTITPATLPNGSLGVPYPASAGTLTVTGGLGPYSFQVSNGALPPGLLLVTTGSSTGLIFGIPQREGSYSFEITATDSLGCVATAAYILTIECPGGTLSPLFPTKGKVGKPYSSGSSLTVSGGAFAYNFRVASGSLPPGLILTGSGTTSASIIGIPTKKGKYHFTIVATVTNGPEDSCELFQICKIKITKKHKHKIRKSSHSSSSH